MAREDGAWPYFGRHPLLNGVKRAMLLDTVRLTESCGVDPLNTAEHIVDCLWTGKYRWLDLLELA
jgi:hypothetical protein